MFNRLCSLVVILLVAALTSCATVAGFTEAPIIRAKNEVAPALVHVRPVKEVFRAGERQEVLVTGSGFIISADGYVVTNEHVAGDSNFVTCYLYDQEEVSARVVGVDPSTDIAVLKLVTNRTDLPYVKLGDSARLEAGETVLALGSPHGLARSVSAGIVSVTDRYLESRGGMTSPYNNWIQTDAAINPGNSGGPLVNLQGEVIGINTRRLSSADNVGFAIPINLAKEVIGEIIDEGRVVRSSIGVEFQEMIQQREAADRRGVMIADVDPLSPAFQAQIRPGDILIEVNSEPVNARFEEDLPAVRKLIADIAVGQAVNLTILRDGQQLDVPITTIEAQRIDADEIELEEWGMTVSELTPEIIRQAQLPVARGVVVSGTLVGGIASNAGFQQNEIILEIDEEPVDDLADFQRQYEQRLETGQELILFRVKRGALTRFVLLKQRPEAAAPGVE
ncbi:MAG: trypsin-like peptidase domain-containing protein [Candidatus Hydrogenedentales bacterium]